MSMLPCRLNRLYFLYAKAKKCCIAVATELFFSEGGVKKSKTGMAKVGLTGHQPKIKRQEIPPAVNE